MAQRKSAIEEKAKDQGENRTSGIVEA